MYRTVIKNYTGRLRVVSSFFLPEEIGASNIKLIRAGDRVLTGNKPW
jgi:hypothetical protein